MLIEAEFRRRLKASSRPYLIVAAAGLGEAPHWMAGILATVVWSSPAELVAETGIKPVCRVVLGPDMAAFGSVVEPAVKPHCSTVEPPPGDGRSRARSGQGVAWA